MSYRATTLFLALLLSGASGGLLFGWVVSVLPGLRRVADDTYVSTMQTINTEIVNPGFIIPFLVTPIVLTIAAWGQFRAGNSRRGLLLSAACVTYLVGVLAVTFGGNVPLNNTLEAFELDTASAQEITNQRANFETAWNRWHYGRTLGAIVAFGLTASAAIAESEGQ